jgi:citronellyl-CoA dehydrogenase
VPLDAKGVERAKKLKKLGMWSSDTAQLFFDEVRVPARNLIGDEGAGFFMQMLQFQEERLWGAANAVSGMDDALRETIDYTRERETFGQPVLANQVVHFRLAELATEVEALRALVWKATELFVGGEDVTRLASMAKLKSGRLMREVADACLQYWGGMGYMWESRISRMFRDGRLLSIGAGADEIMLGIICKLDGTLPRRKKKEG